MIEDFINAQIGEYICNVFQCQNISTHLLLEWPSHEWIIFHICQGHASQMQSNAVLINKL